MKFLSVVPKTAYLAATKALKSKHKQRYACRTKLT